MEEKSKRVKIKGRTYKQWCDDNRDRVRKLSKKHYAKNYADPIKREMEKARRKRWAQNHKDQVLAMARINYYLRKGLIHRKPCEICGEKATHAHHDDYTRPLYVRWLCPVHHSEWHKYNKPIRGEVDKEMTKKDLQKIKLGLLK